MAVQKKAPVLVRKGSVVNARWRFHSHKDLVQAHNACLQVYNNTTSVHSDLAAVKELEEAIWSSAKEIARRGLLVHTSADGYLVVTRGTDVEAMFLL